MTPICAACRPTPAAPWCKGIADYEIDPASHRRQKFGPRLLAAAKTYRPDYSAAEYQKRGSPPSGEVAGSHRAGERRFWILSPEIRQRIAGETNSTAGRTRCNRVLGQGGPGELRRAIDEGCRGLLRGLTGAGMNKDEATNYARRYQFRSSDDTKDTQLRKLNELENALRYVSTEIGKGRGDEDLLKGFESQFGKPVTPEGAAPVHVSSPDEARKYCRRAPRSSSPTARRTGAVMADDPWAEFRETAQLRQRRRKIRGQTSRAAQRPAPAAISHAAPSMSPSKFRRLSSEPQRAH